MVVIINAATTAIIVVVVVVVVQLYILLPLNIGMTINFSDQLNYLMALHAVTTVVVTVVVVQLCRPESVSMTAAKR